MRRPCWIGSKADTPRPRSKRGSGLQPEGKSSIRATDLYRAIQLRPCLGKCSENERADFAKKIIDAVTGMKAAGIDVIAYGKNARETDRRAPYDFFCVYRVPSAEFQREAERRIAASGWYDYFE
jgi:hypothetical protein